MKWGTLFKDFKEKVGLSQTPSSPSSSSSSFKRDNNVTSTTQDSSASSSSSRDKIELELDFKRHWEEFRSSSSEKGKETALNMTVDVFCRLVKQHTNVAQLLTMLVETHIFSFVVGRAFVTDIEKLKISSKSRSLDVGRVLSFFSDVTKDGIKPGSNLLNAVEVLVSGPIDKQSLLDSGILCCLIHILNALLGPDDGNHQQKVSTEESLLLSEENYDDDVGQVYRLEVEGSVVHIMKALANHPSAAQSLIEDNSLQLLFQMVANGSLLVFCQYKEGLVPLHTIQLHRHAMQILGLLLVNDSGSTAKYIHKHHLIKVLLMAVKDFNPDCGDPAYTMGIVDLLLECVELSYRPEAGGVRLREDIHNAHGYQFLVQFALILSKNLGIEAVDTESFADQNSASEGSHTTSMTPLHRISTALSRLLDVLVNLAQLGPGETTGSAGFKVTKNSHNKPSGHSRSRTTSSDRLADETWEKGNYKVKDLEAVQMLQDIFLKAESRELQAEVLNRMFKIFSSHLENYKLCQQLRTVPLLILNMGDFPPSLQEIILKILEYAVTVVNCIPDQELLSLCCLLQQPITSELKLSILSFFSYLEVGVLEVLLDDLKQHKFLLGSDQPNRDSNQLERKSSSNSFKKHLDGKDAILSSPKLLESGSGKFPLFEVEGTIEVAWDCMVSILRKADANQAAFRSANGVTTVLPFLASNIHRLGVLRVLSCLIIEDVAQAHPEELGALVEVLKSGMVTNVLGSQYSLLSDAKCDTFGAIWRILGVNNSAQRVFGESTGFSLLLTTLHSFQSDGEHGNQSFLMVYIKEFTYLLRVVTAGVCDNVVNRTKLHTIISSHTFYDLLSDSGLICVEYERQVIQLLLELALELVLPPSLTSETVASSDLIGTGSAGCLLITPAGSFAPDKERVYNPSAIRVLLRSLLLFTPKVQLDVLNLVEKLAHAGSFNKEHLTSVGCVELLLETIYPFLSGSSPLVVHALKIVEVLGAYRLSASELRILVRYILQMRLKNSGRILVDMMEKLILMEDMALENVSPAPFVEMDMSKIGHASIQVSLGERSWPPAAGYSFVCWFQFQNFLKLQPKESEASKAGPSKRRSTSNGLHNGARVLRIFSVGAADNVNTSYAELYLQEDGVLTLATSNSSSLSFSGLELDEGRWHHLAVVHSKPNALAGLFQASFAHVYLNGKLKHTGKLGYSPSPVGKPLQVTIGTPLLVQGLVTCQVLTSGSVCFMYILGRGYEGSSKTQIFYELLETDLPLASNVQRPESASKQGSSKADRSGIVWDLERLGNLSLQLSAKKLIFAFDGSCTEASRASGTFSMLNLVDPMSAAASPIGGV
ncbi:Protein SPIRRIG [Camellia lanceoleosa]|uniref:Protein SPIRRIG n=1 Tax=Camellia lanceoleosa TaxID=1840588 RepID=A0ACC0FU73_9ERIC|nr:Protein SPIRRIG [Camellia lanceoleosa]